MHKRDKNDIDYLREENNNLKNKLNNYTTDIKQYESFKNNVKKDMKNEFDNLIEEKNNL